MKNINLILLILTCSINAQAVEVENSTLLGDLAETLYQNLSPAKDGSNSIRCDKVDHRTKCQLKGQMEIVGIETGLYREMVRLSPELSKELYDRLSARLWVDDRFTNSKGERIYSLVKKIPAFGPNDETNRREEPFSLITCNRGPVKEILSWRPEPTVLDETDTRYYCELLNWNKVYIDSKWRKSPRPITKL